MDFLLGIVLGANIGRAITEYIYKNRWWRLCKLNVAVHVKN